MDNSLFVEVREAISQWITSNNERLRNNNISLEILKDDKDCLRVELNFGKLLAEILVAEPDFAPYRYVSFQAVGVVNGVPNFVHFWYDEDGMGIKEVIKNLDKAVTIVWEKNNSQGT